MEIKNKETLLEALRQANQKAGGWFSAIPAAEFFTRQADAWSASDNVDHLIKAVKPITLALKMPRLALQGMFGKAERPSKTYTEICIAYEDEIAKGAQASGRFLPDQETPTHPEEQKKQLLDGFSKVGEALLSALEKWGDAELDQYLLPHPILGKLTMREMLFFTVYHNLRHARIEGD